MFECDLFSIIKSSAWYASIHICSIWTKSNSSAFNAYTSTNTTFTKVKSNSRCNLDTLSKSPPHFNIYYVR